MISLYSGTPGSGKTVNVARTVHDRFVLGKPVIAVHTNFDKSKFKKAKYKFLQDEEFTPEWLIAKSERYFKKHSFREGALLLIIDEAQLYFNAREWQKTDRNGWLDFFTKHRHYGYDIIFVAQFDRMIDRQIRSLFEYEYIHRKVKNFGIGGFLMSLLAGGNLHCAVKMWYPIKEKIGSEMFKSKRKYWKLYNSYVVPRKPQEHTGEPVTDNARKKPILLRLFFSSK